MKAILYIFFSLAMWVTANAATPVLATKANTSLVPLAAQSFSQADMDLKVLQMQSAAIKEYHSSLLSTVYWALGTVVTVAALLVGFGWLTNFKFHEAEKQRLKEEMEARLKEAASALEARLGSIEVEFTRLVDSRLDAYLDRVAREVDLARAEASRSAQENAEALTQLKSTIGSLQQAHVESAKRDSKLEATVRQVEEMVWDIKGIPTNILITQSEGLRAAIAADDRYFIRTVLSRMEATITKSILPGKHSMPKTMLDLIDSDLANAEKVERISASSVRELVKQIAERPQEGNT